jgi:hypothetical protein
VRGPETTGARERQDTSPLRVALAVTTIAALLGLAHLVWPSIKPDTATLVLLAIAVAPWLGHIFRSVELPFGVKVEYQELRERVERQAGRLDEVAARVESVEDRVFEISGSAGPEQTRNLNDALRGYAAYLDLLGLTWSGSLPTVVIGAATTAWGEFSIERNAILLTEKGADDTSLLLRQYTHQVLWNRQRAVIEGTSQMAASAVAIESGLADYLSCSYRDDPRIGAIASQNGEVLFEDLSEQHTFAELDKVKPTIGDRYSFGKVWASLVWAVRRELGRAAADQISVRAWSSSTPDDAFDASFARQLVEQGEPYGAGQAVQNVLTRYGYGLR